MRIRQRARTGLVLLMLAGLLLPAAPLRAEEPASADPERGVTTGREIVEGVEVVVDLLLIRPIGVAATALGLVFFAPAALLSLADYPDTTEEAWELFVLTPARTVYERPLGDL